MFWKKGFKVHVKGFSRNFIDMHVRLDVGEVVWKVTGFYGHLERGKRGESF